MDDFSERLCKVTERIMHILESRIYDDDVQHDLKGLLQMTQLLQELCKLQSGEAAGVNVTVTMEGGLNELSE